MDFGVADSALIVMSALTDEGSTRSFSNSESSGKQELGTIIPSFITSASTRFPGHARKRRLCAADGCQKRPSFAEVGESPARCKLHKAKGDINVKNPICNIQGCFSRSRFGMPGSKPVHCKDHRQPGDINPCRPPCIHPGCTVTPTYGEEGRKPARCAKHKKPNDINTNRQRCGEKDCRERPCFVNYATGVKHCLRHFSSGDTGGLRGMCQARDPDSEAPCRKYATFGEVQGKPLKCKDHKQAEDVDVLNKMCVHTMCFKRPSFAPAGEAARRCKSHALSGDVNRGRRTEFRYLGGLVNEKGDLAREINLRSKTAWACIRRDGTELFDRLGAPFRLKARLLQAEAMEALLYGCMTWSPSRDHYRLLQTTHHRLLLRVIGYRGNQGTYRQLSYAQALKRVDRQSVEATAGAVYAIETIFSNSSAALESTNSSASVNGSAVEKELIETIEADPQVTVVGEVQLGELLCDSLAEAEDAPFLRFSISDNEMLLVKRMFYSVVSGESFTGGVGRRTWIGTVTIPEQTKDEAFARRVSMTWGEICDVEIQVLVLYSDQALDLVGVTSATMESMVSASFADVNEGFANSQIGINLTIAHQTRLPYEEGSSSSAIELEFLSKNEDVQAFRNEYGADLILLVGELHDVCGIAHGDWAYAMANPNCFSNLVIAHEFGHNLGCNHNREHAGEDQDYAHGYRYCSGTAIYTTIMSYTAGCTAKRVNYFANPDVSYLDRPTGTETENCARAIEENKEVISNFREDIRDAEQGDDGGDDQESDGADFGDLLTRGKNWLFFVPIGLAFYFLKRRCSPGTTATKMLSVAIIALGRSTLLLMHHGALGGAERILHDVGAASTNYSSTSSSSAVYAIETIFTNSSGDPESANVSSSTNVSAVGEELIENIEVDQQVTVIGEVQLGELLCDSLVEAENAPLLQFAISANETLVVNRTSYSVASGETFTGGVARRMWIGTVTDPEQAEDEAFPRRVSMTWGEVCDVQVALEFLPDGPPLRVDFTGRRRLGGSRGGRDCQQSLAGENGRLSSIGGHRKLQAENVEIQALVLYSGQSLDMMGVSAVQMESMVSASIADANEGFANSKIGVEITIVNQAMLPFEEGDSSSGEKLDSMRQNSEVQALRNEVGADLVLLVGELYDVCGIAYFLLDTRSWYSEYAYALVNPICFSNLVIAHEFGHNLGCDHNREHAAEDQDYAHGYRYCSGDARYTTIMSYTAGCTATRANYFANPDVSYLDRPTGTETENCARAIEENKEVVSEFREQIYDGQPGESDEDSNDHDSWDSTDSGAAAAVAPQSRILLLVETIIALQLACMPLHHT
eukprot:g10557.t1